MVCNWPENDVKVGMEYRHSLILSHQYFYAYIYTIAIKLSIFFNDPDLRSNEK